MLGYVWPEPGSSAAGTRVLELLRAFADAGWERHFASAANTSEHQVDLAALGIGSHTIRLNCSSFDDFVRQLAPDLVVFDRFVTEEQFGWRVAEARPDALRVLDTEDLHSLRLTRGQLHRQALAAQGPAAGPVAAGGADLYRAMLAQGDILREVAAILRSDVSLMISEAEIALLHEYFAVPDSQLYHLPFMPAPRTQKPPDWRARRGFISIGNFRHAPNWDAVLWLKQVIWPAIRTRLPGAELSVCGAYPPPKATALHQPREGFYVRGWVSDACTTISQHRVCLAPLRFGAGAKGKLIDAMQTDTPSVTTAIGAEGMHGTLAWPGAVADNADTFARAAVALHEQQAHWEEASNQARRLLQERFQSAEHARALVEYLAQLHQQLPAHRQQHFLSRLLNQQTLRSHEFMSRWIEAKSRHSMAINPTTDA